MPTANQLRWKVIDLFGIPVYLDITFLVLMLLFVNGGSSFSAGLAEAMILAVSIVLHELGHSLTGRAFGCETSHITLSFIGGCASMTSMPRRGWEEFTVAITGPLVSFALCGAGYALLRFLPIENHFLAHMLVYLFWLNLVLGAFNLLPGFPMDGGRIFRSVMMLFLSRPKATLVAMWVGRAFAVLLGLSGVYAFVNGGSWAVVKMFIAWTIWRDGYREYQLALMEASWTCQDFRAKVSPPPYER
ncbi:MAG: site-2 protease family protein [Kiritimatiellae bacterium]|nr:site-2 protease family protein [Kiritimatiellia bacterium]